MTKRTLFILPAIFALTVAAIIGCSGGSSGEPIGPGPNGELTILYCRVVHSDGETRVQWATDRAARGELRYGTASYTNLVNASIPADSHDVPLGGLSHSTNYIFRLTARDNANLTADYEGTFITPAKATPEPIITGLSIAEITETTAQVSWRTDEPASTILYYGRGSYADSVVNTVFAFTHSVLLEGLEPSATYLLRPEAVDTTNLRGYGRDTSFVTAARMTLWFPDTALAVGDTVRLPIYIQDAQDLAALHFKLTFTVGSVEVVAIEEGPFYTNRRGFIIFSGIRNSVGEAVADLTWSITYSGNQRVGTDADGGGIVAYARLRGLDAGPVNAALAADSTYGLDIFANVRACSLRAGQVDVRP